MTRQQLVEALRVLHTDDEIVKIKQQKKRLEIHFQNNRRMSCGMLVIPTPTQNATIKGLQTQPKSRDPITGSTGNG